MKSSKHHQTPWEANIPNHFHFTRKSDRQHSDEKRKKKLVNLLKKGRLRVLIVTQKKISPLLPNTFFIIH